MYRQGDILLVPTNQKSTHSTARPAENGRIVLAQGEATGHHHSIDATTATLIDHKPFPLLIVTEATDLIHPEHASISVAPGLYFVVRQREYDPSMRQQEYDLLRHKEGASQRHPYVRD